MGEKGHTGLLPCPFCGEPPCVSIQPVGREHAVFCEQCEARGPTRRKIDQAPIAWNTRSAVNTYPAVEGLVKALELAQQFIRNGVEFGYIRMPDDDSDFAHQTLPEIDSALSRFRSLQNGGAKA